MHLHKVCTQDRSRTTFFRRLLALGIIFFFLSFDLSSFRVLSALEQSLDARQAVEAAWSRVKESGSYAFDADILQHTIPTATITNAGRRSRQEMLSLHGRVPFESGSDP